MGNVIYILTGIAATYVFFKLSKDLRDDHDRELMTTSCLKCGGTAERQHISEDRRKGSYKCPNCGSFFVKHLRRFKHPFVK